MYLKNDNGQSINFLSQIKKLICTSPIQIHAGCKETGPSARTEKIPSLLNSPSAEY